MTAWETILVAMKFLHDCGDDLPHKDCIVVRAWELNPETFGLSHTGDYPDSHRVSMELPKMLSRGLIERPRPLLYRLTPNGRKVVREVLGRGKVTPVWESMEQ